MYIFTSKSDFVFNNLLLILATEVSVVLSDFYGTNRNGYCCRFMFPNEVLEIGQKSVCHTGIVLF